MSDGIWVLVIVVGVLAIVAAIWWPTDSDERGGR